LFECHALVEVISEILSLLFAFLQETKAVHSDKNTKHQWHNSGYGGEWCGRPTRQTAGGGKMSDKINLDLLASLKFKLLSHMKEIQYMIVAF
jgi:hypothetical protein